MKRNNLVLILVAFLAIIFSGCGSMSRRDGSMPKSSSLLEPAGVLKFNDLPVPAGFRLVPESSYSFESSGVRVGVLKYQGKADIEQVINFFKEQMPMYSWSLLNAIEYGERLLNYERENETCIISLLPKGKNITITISLGPRSQAQKKAKSTLK